MKRIWRYIRPYTGFIIWTMIIKLMGAVLELLIPYFMEIILDDVVPAGETPKIFVFGGLMLLASGGCLACNVIANRMSAVSSGKITLAIRHDLFDRLQRLSARQMDTLTLSSAESRLTSDTYNVNQLLARMQRLGIRAPILLLGGIVMMLTMDVPLAMVLIAMLPLIALIVYIVTKKSVPLYKEEQTVLDRVVRVLQENITGIRVIKALSKTEHEKERFNEVNDELMEIDRRAGFITAATNPLSSLVLNLGLTVMVLIGAYRVNGGLTESGVIIAFLQYFVMILNAMLGVTRIFVMWSKGEASAVRVADVLEIGEDMTVVPVPDAPAGSVPHVEFRDVTFSYTGIGANIDHLSFKLERGESLGILGPTGCGKSTVLNLLMRLYDPDSGEILIDGKDVRGIDGRELRSRFGVVFQNDFVMEGTIRDNIRFFRDVPETAVLAAADDAQATEFIETRDGKMDYGVAVRGNNLSGGQKQRLLIARALAGDPEILLLDDASSALDYKTDAELRRALRQHHGGVTTVMIAQRISSVKNCDHILMLDDGVPVAYGTHDELMAASAAYRRIAASQMGDGEVGA